MVDPPTQKHSRPHFHNIPFKVLILREVVIRVLSTASYFAETAGPRIVVQ